MLKVWPSRSLVVCFVLQNVGITDGDVWVTEHEDPLRMILHVGGGGRLRMGMEGWYVKLLLRTTFLRYLCGYMGGQWFHR